MNKWYSGEGKNSDVVVGAIVRLARNLADAPFPIRMNNEIRRNTVKKIFAAVKNSPYAGEFDLVDLSAVSTAGVCLRGATADQPSLCPAKGSKCFFAQQGRQRQRDALRGGSYSLTGARRRAGPGGRLRQGG